MTRHDPRTINTTLQGAGTTTPVVPLPTVTPMVTGTGSDLDLKIKRTNWAISLEKEISHGLSFEAEYKRCDREGARLWGKGFTCTSGAAPCCAAGTTLATGWALLMLPEPINSTTHQFEAKLNYIADRYSLSGGYSGSLYNNAYSTMTPSVPGSLYNPVGNLLPLSAGLQPILNLPMYLPPDNQAHEFFLMGNYSFSKTAKATFKAAYTHATQTQDFGAGSNAPAGRSDLGGELNTLFLHSSISARPIPKLTLRANVNYDDKKDETPIALYNTEGTATFTNGHVSDRKLSVKADASYQLPDGYRATAEVNYASQDRGTFTPTSAIAGLTAIRQKNDETGWRIELRKLISETLTGAIAYEEGKREGSTWLRPCTAAAVTAGACANTLVPSAIEGVAPVSDNGTGLGYATGFGTTTGGFPWTMTNRDRSKVRASADWSPTERLSLTAMIDVGKDSNDDPGVATKGRQQSKMNFYGIDLNYAINDRWSVSAYASRGEQDLWIAHSTGYIADIANTNDALGLSLKGKPLDRLEIVAGITFANDRNAYLQTLDPAASANNAAFLAYTGGVPDVVYRQVALNFSGKYALDKKSALRLDIVHQRNKLDEWTWENPDNGTPFAYSDGTTVSIQPNQNVTFVGVGYSYRFR